MIILSRWFLNLVPVLSVNVLSKVFPPKIYFIIKRKQVHPESPGCAAAAEALLRLPLCDHPKDVVVKVGFCSLFEYSYKVISQKTFLRLQL